MYVLIEMGQRESRRSPSLLLSLDGPEDVKVDQNLPKDDVVVVPTIDISWPEIASCELCEAEHDAVFSCADCHLKLCADVCERLHKKGLKDHNLTRLPVVNSCVKCVKQNILRMLTVVIVN
jgi:hypothetical protein